ncbi:MAG: hypothetical protein LBS53_04795 [Synergistaceae bacterium]|jgi:hypothetical protein|nr:hypothetical protein [Synergistaceae bacterium]
MPVKSLKRILFSILAVTMLLSLSSSVWAASKILDPNKANGGKKNDEYELKRELDGGIHLVVNNVSIIPEIVSPELPIVLGQLLALECTVTPDDDTVLSFGKESELFDANGVRQTDAQYTMIGGEKTSKREIIGGYSTKCHIVYGLSSGYKVTKTYPRVKFEINGEELTFRDVPGK